MDDISANEAVGLCTKEISDSGKKMEPVESEHVDLPESDKTKSSENVKIATPESDSAGDKNESTPLEPKDITFKLIFSRQKMDITWNANDSVASLKMHIQKLTGVPNTMQKLMFKGMCVVLALTYFEVCNSVVIDFQIKWCCFKQIIF